MAGVPIITTELGLVGSLTLNLPPLLSVYTPPTSCSKRWIINDSNRTLGYVTTTGQSTITLDNLVFSTHRDHPLGIPIYPNQTYDAEYQYCQHGQVATPVYKPGVFPSEHTIGAVSKMVETFSGQYHISGMQNVAAGQALQSLQSSSLLTHSRGMTHQQVGIDTDGIVVGDSLDEPSSSKYFVNYCVSAISTSLTAMSLYYWGDGVGWLSRSKTVMTQGYALANPIFLAFRDTDLASLPTAEASSMAQIVGLDFTAPATPASTTSLPRETNPSFSLQESSTPARNQLSAGAKAGIGIGATVGALVIGFLIVFLLKRKRARTSPTDPTIPTTEGPAEMEDQDGSLASRKWFLGGRWRNETAAEEIKLELDSRDVFVVPGPPVELEGSSWNRHGEGAVQHHVQNYERTNGF